MADEYMRILVVDDDPIDFVFLKKGFELLVARVQLHHCQDPADVLTLLDSKACDFVFLDLNLGGESGIEVLKSIRQSDRFKAVPVIVFSSSVSRLDVVESYAAGASGYVEKPLTIDMYRKFAKAFCDFWVDVATIKP